MEPNTPQAPADLKARIKSTYDVIAPEYNRWTDCNTKTRVEFLDKLTELFEADQRLSVSILELGCGAGLPATKTLLSIPNATVVANDISSTQIEIGKKNLAESADRVTWNEGDMMSLSFPEDSLDAVVGMYSLIHLPRTEQKELVTRISKWLKTGGYLLVNFTSSDMKCDIDPSWLMPDGWMFWSGWGTTRVKEMVEITGFEAIIAELRGDDGDGQFFWVLAKKV